LLPFAFSCFFFFFHLYDFSPQVTNLFVGMFVGDLVYDIWSLEKGDHSFARIWIHLEQYVASCHCLSRNELCAKFIIALLLTQNYPQKSDQSSQALSSFDKGVGVRVMDGVLNIFFGHCITLPRGTWVSFAFSHILFICFFFLSVFIMTVQFDLMTPSEVANT
jgi:hypothetical protein